VSTSSRRVSIRPVALLGIGLILVLIAVMFAARGGGVDKGEAGNQRIAARAAVTPEKRCTSERTYDRVKQELFRSAAQLRTSDQAAFDRLSAYSALRMERPLLRSHDKELGTVRCSGTLFLDLPPGVAVVGGRRSLTADIDYILQPAADGSGDVVMLEGDGPITVPLATLARTGETRMAAGGDYPAVIAQQQGEPPAAEPPIPSPVAVPPPRQATSPAPRLEPDTVAKAKPKPAAAPPVVRPDRTPVPSRTAERKTVASPKTGARPSFNCRYARTRGEIAICKDGGLAALDRQMAAQYYRAIASASAAQRRDLKNSRDAFLRRRDRCRDATCIANSYQQRIREISEIRTGSR
jgi:hypothetical protein